MKRSWSSSLGVIVLLGVTGCGAAGPTQVAASPRASAAVAVNPVPAKSEIAPKSAQNFDYDHESDSDEVFLRETDRTIALYRDFLAHAGNDPTYAAEAQRSRQQIEDLTAAEIFVRNGMAARKARGK